MSDYAPVMPVLNEEIESLYSQMLKDKLSPFTDDKANEVSDINPLRFRIKQWLNGCDIDSYLRLICQRNSENPGYPKVCSVSTLVYPSIGKSKKTIERFIEKTNVFEYDFVLHPVLLEDSHWILAVYYMGEKRIYIYDPKFPLYDRYYEKVSQTLMTFLDVLREGETQANNWTAANYTAYPKQTNNVDCGVFVCQAAEVLSRACFPRFTEEDMPTFRKHMLHELVTQKLHNAKSLGFAPIIGRGLKFNESGDVAEVVGCDRQKRVLTKQAIRPMEKITIKILKAERVSGYTFSFGITDRSVESGNPSKLISSNVYLKDPIDKLNYLSFWITERGEFVAQIGNKEPLVYSDVDVIAPHQISFDLNGAVKAIKLVSVENLLHDNFKIYNRAVSTENIPEPARTIPEPPKTIPEPAKKKERLEEEETDNSSQQPTTSNDQPTSQPTDVQSPDTITLRSGKIGTKTPEQARYNPGLKRKRN